VLKRMEVFSSNPSAPELPLGGFMPSDDPVQIFSITGLEPVRADIASTALASGRGEHYQGSTVGKRNIVMTLGFNPDWVEQTMATLRQKLYGYFMPESWCKLRFFSDHMPTVDIEGYVESIDPNIFSADPEVQISVLCHKPDFIEVDAIIYNGVVDDGTLELEFDYQGTIDTGFELRVDRSVANPSYTGSLAIANMAPTEAQIMELAGITVDTERYLKVTTVPNGKRIQSVSHTDGTAVNLLSKMSDDSVWPILKPGKNYFSVGAEESGQAWTLAYFNRFGGL
jgi:hypothetical protein